MNNNIFIKLLLYLVILYYTMSKFCPKCNYLLDITKNIILLQIDDVNKLIDLLVNGTINI